MPDGRMHTPDPTPPPLYAFLAISYRNHHKSLAYFNHLAPLALFIFTKRKNQKGRGAWHNASPPKYARGVGYNIIVQIK